MRSNDSAALILLYHRVTRLQSDPQLLAVAPDRFAAHIAYLRENATPLSLADYVECQRSRRIPQRAVVVTFDDGYADNFEQAKPVLERYAVPATVFVTTSGLEADREFWWDDLERILLATPSSPADAVVIPADSIEVSMPGGSNSPEAAHNGWTVLSESVPTPRHAAYRAMCDAIRPLRSEARRAIVERLEHELGVQRAIRWTHRTMSADQVRGLAAGGLIEIGAHTLTHPLLAALSRKEQEREIVDSKRTLEDLIGLPVASFSYPFGGRRDYTAESVNLVRSAGFARACANVAGPATAACDPWQLPRVLVRDWPVEEFAARLESFWSPHAQVSAHIAG